MNRMAGRAAGFTLLEILLALTLMSLVMLGVWGALSGATRITHATDAQMAQSEAVQATQHFLRTWLASVQPLQFRNVGVARARMFRADASVMQYIAPLPMQSGHAGLYLQTLKLAKDGNADYVLKLEYVPFSSGQSGPDKPETHVLLTHLRGGRFRYLSPPVLDKPATWRDDWEKLDSMPLAIDIHLEPGWQVKVPFPDMLIPLRMHGSTTPAMRGVTP